MTAGQAVNRAGSNMSWSVSRSVSRSVSNLTSGALLGWCVSCQVVHDVVSSSAILRGRITINAGGQLYNPMC